MTLTDIIAWILVFAIFIGLFYLFRFIWRLSAKILWWSYSGIVYLFTGQKPEQKQKPSVTSSETEHSKLSICPYCGAPLKLNASSICEYCGMQIRS